jgi:hypothetical protein
MRGYEVISFTSIPTPEGGGLMEEE